GGQRQALTLLTMSLSKPELVLLDEHTAALDPRNASKVMELTDRFIEEYGFTVMMITHNMQHAIDNGNRLLMMDEGRIILDISGEEKKNLTVDALVKKFHEVRKKDFATDKTLLAD
ncbi:MAG: ABC transporter ATP-binding protein, partial [Spirochaetales bacterium]|nr:ABC transporter ATP-binding protein [Spirochaetales bacterium]